MTNYDLNAILKRIKDLKKEKNITNIGISEKSSIPLSTLNKITSGQTKAPPLSSIIKIADSLGVTADFIVYGKDIDSENTLEIKLEPHRTAIKKYLELNEEHQAQIRGMILMLETNEQKESPSKEKMGEDMLKIIGDFKGTTNASESEITSAIETKLFNKNSDESPAGETVI